MWSALRIAARRERTEGDQRPLQVMSGIDRDAQTKVYRDEWGAVVPAAAARMTQGDAAGTDSQLRDAGFQWHDAGYVQIAIQTKVAMDQCDSSW